jgi:hypothetical protein
MGSPTHRASVDRRKLILGDAAPASPTFPLSHYTFPTHTCLQTSASWVTVGNSHPPAGLVLFLRKENSWVILKMELKIHLTSQLQLSGPEAAFKDRSCGCDMKAKRLRCFVLPQQDRLHTL